jgi:hypothetical protein
MRISQKADKANFAVLGYSEVGVPERAGEGRPSVVCSRRSAGRTEALVAEDVRKPTFLRKRSRRDKDEINFGC